MNILLTGNEGFIGSHLFSNLKKEHNVIGLDIKNNNDILSCDLPKTLI
jgi:nucleoside-diphosphate-sugar epimerase